MKTYTVTMTNEEISFTSTALDLYIADRLEQVRLARVAAAKAFGPKGGETIAFFQRQADIAQAARDRLDDARLQSAA